jgi:hypothetical protein
VRLGLAALVEDIEHFQRRVLEDGLSQACSSYWLRRAGEFARVGTAACDEIAEACRHKAELSLVGGSWPEIDDDVVFEALG